LPITEGEECKLTIDASLVKGLTNVFKKYLVAVNHIGFKAESREIFDLDLVRSRNSMFK
jgi:hypothetical protein